MKVYTHYYKIGNNEGLRWRTLLRFGTSWDIIGSVVMKNPGSSTLSNPMAISDGSILSRLSEFDDVDSEWYEFTEDDTMRKLAVLFASYYQMDNTRQLNGVIQIFNLFYIMDANAQRAEQKIQKAGMPASFHTQKDLLDYDIAHLVNPVYLGFGDLAFSDVFVDNARRYFATLMQGQYSTEYLNERFEDNSFYHPQYLCGYGRNNPKSVYIRGKFKESPMNDDEIKSGVYLPNY